jgi:hypothetical protein
VEQITAKPFLNWYTEVYQESVKAYPRLRLLRENLMCLGLGLVMLVSYKLKDTWARLLCRHDGITYLRYAWTHPLLREPRPWVDPLKGH